MVEHDNLVEKLNKLSDSQQERLFSRLEVDKAHIRMNVTPSQKNQDLIDISKQKKFGLERIEKALDDLAFFKEFMPAGTYPVGDELLQREESREQEAMQAAETRGDDPEDYKITPEKFYSFQRGTEWLGVFREWDAPRSFRTELLETTIRNSQNRHNCPATAIIGHGGSGKSVALRRLALDLVDKAYKVWWVERPERLVELGLDDFIEHEGKPQFLLIDEIQYLDASCVERLRRHLQQYPFLVLVVAGRHLPRELQLGAKYRFTPNEATDRITILDKIAEVFPAWATTTSQLKVESLREARLVRILLVLARGQEPVPKTLEELEEVFLRILVDDLERIREQFPGLATAIMDAAIFREVGMAGLYPSVLIALANDYQPCARIPILFELVTDNSRWDVVTSLLSFDQSQNYFLFHHDELAEGLIQASEKGLIEPYIDDPYRKAILDRTICLAVNSEGNTEIGREISEVGSELLRLFFLYKLKNAVAPTTILKYINKLLDAKVAHYAYLSLVVENILNLTQEQRLKIFLAAAELVPTRQIGNSILWRSVLKWVEDSYPKSGQDEICQQLYQAGCRSYQFINGWSKNLPPTQAKLRAREWIKDSQAYQVLCRCLELLGQEAKQEAQEKIASWAKTDSSVLCRCFAIAGETPEAQKAADEILLRWQAGKKLDFGYKMVALRGPFDTELRKKMAIQVLRNWHKEYRPVLTSALTAFWNDPDAVTDYCHQILRRWYKDIEYQHRKRNIKKRHDGHIIKALAHPSLRRQAQAAAERMLQRETNCPGFLTPLLHQRALEIAQGQFPSWTGKEEETEPLQTPQMGMLRPPKVPEVLSQSVSSPQILSSKPKRIKNPQPPKLPSQSVKKSESRNLDSWQEKLDKLKEFYLDE